MPKLGIYKVERTDEYRFDEYDSFVCAATSPSQARAMHPCHGDEPDQEPDNGLGYPSFSSQLRRCTWPVKPDTLRVTLIGRAYPGQEAGIILASFNAG